MKFSNHLPQVPVEAKLLTFKIPPEKEHSCLDINRDFDFLSGVSSRIPVDFINPDIYKEGVGLPFDNSDPLYREVMSKSDREEKNQDENLFLQLTRANSKSRFENLNSKDVSKYLRKTQIMTDKTRTVTYGETSKPESFGARFSTGAMNSVAPASVETPHPYTSKYRDEVADMIEDQFEAQKLIKVGLEKPGKPGVTATKVLPLTPAFEYLLQEVAICRLSFGNNFKKFRNNIGLMQKKRDDKLDFYEAGTRSMLGKRAREGEQLESVRPSKYIKQFECRYKETDQKLMATSIIAYNQGQEANYIVTDNRMEVSKHKTKKKVKLAMDLARPMDLLLNQDSDEENKTTTKKERMLLVERAMKRQEVQQRQIQLAEGENFLSMNPDTQILTSRPDFGNLSEDSPSEVEEEAPPAQEIKAVAQIIEEDSDDDEIKGVGGIQKPVEEANVEESDNDSLF